MGGVYIMSVSYDMYVINILIPVLLDTELFINLLGGLFLSKVFSGQGSRGRKNVANLATDAYVSFPKLNVYIVIP